MRRHDRTRTSLMISLACMTLLGGYGVGAEPLQAHSSRSQEAESLRIVEGSKVTLQYVATVPGSTGIDYGNISEFIQGRHEIFPALEKEGDVVQNELGHFATVAEVSDGMAVLDYNHPLAGKPLVVQVKILKVENP